MTFSSGRVTIKDGLGQPVHGSDDTPKAGLGDGIGHDFQARYFYWYRPESFDIFFNPETSEINKIKQIANAESGFYLRLECIYNCKFYFWQDVFVILTLHSR